MKNLQFSSILSFNLILLFLFFILKFESGHGYYRNIHDESRRLLMLIDPQTLLHRCINADVFERYERSPKMESSSNMLNLMPENLGTANLDQLLALESNPRDAISDVDYADDVGDEPLVDYFDSPQHQSRAPSVVAKVDQQQSESVKRQSKSMSQLRQFTSDWSDRNSSSSNDGTRKSGKLLQTSSGSGNSDGPKRISRLTSQVLSLPPVASEWSFQCPVGKSGYFADVENDCRVYYVCNGERGERQRFTCPTGTRFNQENKNCDWWDKVQCSDKDIEQERKRRRRR